MHRPTALFAALGSMLESLGEVKLLFTHRKNEVSPTLLAGQFPILEHHSLPTTTEQKAIRVGYKMPRHGPTAGPGELRARFLRVYHSLAKNQRRPEPYWPIPSASRIAAWVMGPKWTETKRPRGSRTTEVGRTPT